MHKPDYIKKAQISSGHGSPSSAVTPRRARTEEALSHGKEGCFPAAAIRPATPLRSGRNCCRGGLSKLAQTCSLFRRAHTYPTAEAAKQTAHTAAHTKITQNRKNQQHGSAVLTESPKAAANFPAVSVPVSHQSPAPGGRKPNHAQILFVKIQTQTTETDQMQLRLFRRTCVCQKFHL